MTEPFLQSSGAIIFAEDSTQAIGQTLNFILTHRIAARKMGTAGRELYEKHFALEVTVSTLTGQHSLKRDTMRIAAAV